MSRQEHAESLGEQRYWYQGSNGAAQTREDGVVWPAMRDTLCVGMMLFLIVLCSIHIFGP
jgi:hypothetical protein